MARMPHMGHAGEVLMPHVGHWRVILLTDLHQVSPPATTLHIGVERFFCVAHEWATRFRI